jgi:hypothetical protein
MRATAYSRSNRQARPPSEIAIAQNAGRRSLVSTRVTRKSTQEVDRASTLLGVHMITKRLSTTSKNDLYSSMAAMQLTATLSGRDGLRVSWRMARFWKQHPWISVHHVTYQCPVDGPAQSVPCRYTSFARSSGLAR